MPSDLTLGAEYNYDGLEDEVIGYERYMKQKVRIAGTYLQNEWKNERWSLLVGGRLDKHNLVDHVIFSPRANLRFNPNRSINCVPAMPEASVPRKLSTKTYTSAWWAANG